VDVVGGELAVTDVTGEAGFSKALIAPAQNADAMSGCEQGPINLPTSSG
jgi:hypothetical protein